MIKLFGRTLVLTASFASVALGQTGRPGPAADTSSAFLSRVYKYEIQKKEKASALAWSLVVPGGAVFYSGRRPELGAVLGFVESLSIGTILYVRLQAAGGRSAVGDRAMTNVFSIVLLGAKVFEICEGFALVDDANLSLWDRVSHAGNAPGTGPRSAQTAIPGIMLRLTVPL
jgi:hypothetical protein